MFKPSTYYTGLMSSLNVCLCVNVMKAEVLHAGPVIPPFLSVPGDMQLSVVVYSARHTTCVSDMTSTVRILRFHVIDDMYCYLSVGLFVIFMDRAASFIPSFHKTICFSPVFFSYFFTRLFQSMFWGMIEVIDFISESCQFVSVVFV
jgi:hypothetical protein